MRIRTTLPCLLILLLSTCARAQTESQYIDVLAAHLQGKQETAVAGGRIDILTEQYAIEVERAPKWKNSIGQALWYGLQTNKQPGIILLVASPQQRKYAIQLGSALNYAGLNERIKVWLWPDDFPGVLPTPKPHPASKDPEYGATSQFWLNLNGNKRHTADCKWFANTKNGRYCTEEEGVAAGCCH